MSSQHPTDANQLKMVSNGLLSFEMVFPGTLRLLVNPHQVQTTMHTLERLSFKKGMFKNPTQFIYDSILGNSVAMEAFLPRAILMSARSSDNIQCWDGYGRYIGKRDGGDIVFFPDNETVLNILLNKAEDSVKYLFQHAY